MQDERRSHQAKSVKTPVWEDREHEGPFNAAFSGDVAVDYIKRSNHKVKITECDAPEKCFRGPTVQVSQAARRQSSEPRGVTFMENA